MNWPLLIILAASACEEATAPPPPTPQPICHPVFLASKLDDDDGDGNPRDTNFPYDNDEDDDIADHAWIRDATGEYHLFFHNESLTAGSWIEHYVSDDLRTMTYVGVALRPNPAGWDSYALWAPHVVEVQGVYYMFYTGVEGSDNTGSERIGLATSPDLYTWTKYPINRCPGTSDRGCVYDCNESWTTWGDPVALNRQQCRDPFVIWDEVNSQWVMFATARSRNEYGVVTVATSPDLVAWEGRGFIDATRRLASGTAAQTTGGQAENPFVIARNGTYTLLFTDWQDPEDSFSVASPRTIVQYATSSTLDADTLGSANWIYRGSTPDPGVNALEVLHVGSEWIVSQSVTNVWSGDHPQHRRELRMRRIVWGSGFEFGTAPIEQCDDPTLISP